MLDNQIHPPKTTGKTVISFKAPSEKGGGGSQATLLTEEKSAEKTPDSEEFILCRNCKQIITRPDAGIAVNGSNRHVFANPHGIIFEIACFKIVEGCIHSGPAVSEWTWFPGYTWRITLCSKCLINVGWLFTSSGHNQFYGLILERLLGTL